ncbi:MAG TPA: ABC transporter permease [Thermoanaerobaculia bacterium]|nr:ABC transporter permease [Thermoanaerobaculia bacterium]
MINNYIKIALKVLARRKFFTFISLFGISLTLVVLMVAAAILDNIFAARKPESKFDRVLTVSRVSMTGKSWSMTGGAGYGLLDKYLRGLPGAEATAIASAPSAISMYHGDRKIETHLRRTDGSYWRIVDFQFLEGGPFTEADDRNANFVAVITDDMRTRLYGNQPALNRTFTIEGQTFRVVGVVPAVPITRLAAFSEVWAPIRTLRTRQYEKGVVGTFVGLVLARDASDFGALRNEFARRLDHFVFDDPKSFNRIDAGLDTRFEATARALLGNSFKRSRAAALRTMMGIVALLFLTLPTINLVSINLSRIMERAPEIGVRKAFGASGRTLVGQFVVENIVLTLIGGAIAFVLSVIALSALTRAELVPYAVFDINLRIFSYGMLLAALFGVLSGVYPAWRMSRMQAVMALRGGAR